LANVSVVKQVIYFGTEGVYSNTVILLKLQRIIFILKYNVAHSDSERLTVNLKYKLRSQTSRIS
jgi:hypothetical protein